MYDELDWEDIESRLYSQVYHVSKEYTPPPASSSTNAEDALQSKLSDSGSLTNRNKRYFCSEKDVFSNSRFYISFENSNMTTPNTVCDHVPINTAVGSNSIEVNSEGNIVDQVENNIMVNQCGGIPVIINSETTIANPSNDFFFGSFE
ncbi:hypothetical protein NQ318_009272 [Aromia moschata]|uniref:Uncharacterized protein n=1 Tax=Aromia moschata TaxID=1265417 RepID=A0AAV8YLA2_9CUCU|nr:hypothetical protein NQ318_009272 [Aromia moschata]